MIWKRAAREQRNVYAKNASGDFYVAENCCLWCGVPWVVAPEHFAIDELQCYVKRQPADDAEVSTMISAMNVQELDCIRYKGRDERIIAPSGPEGEAKSLTINQTDDHAPIKFRSSTCSIPF
jgi:hypothetical protein